MRPRILFAITAVCVVALMLACVRVYPTIKTEVVKEGTGEKTPAQIFEEADYLTYLEIEGEIPETEFNYNSLLQMEIIGAPEDNKVKIRIGGSGFVTKYEDKYYILTAGHLHDARVTITSFKAYFKNGAVEELEFVGWDKTLDAALVKFKRADFEYAGKVAELGSSANLKVGQQVVALGSPLGIKQSLSVGYVMNLNLAQEKNFFTQNSLILHHAPINAGNSGGPLINMQGEVVGINVMVTNSQSHFGTPLSIALPIDDVRKILPELVAGTLKKENLLEEIENKINKIGMMALEIQFQIASLKNEKDKGVVSQRFDEIGVKFLAILEELSNKQKEIFKDEALQQKILKDLDEILIRLDELKEMLTKMRESAETPPQTPEAPPSTGEAPPSSGETPPAPETPKDN